MPAPEQLSQINEARRAHIAITYSHPSMLGLLAYDAACYVATQNKADIMIIAGEQSWSDDPTTTGEALAKLAPVGMLTEVVPLRNDNNRLINTSFQAIELAQTIPEGLQTTITAWQFHEGRVEDNIAHNGGEFLRTYVAADPIIEMLWNTAGLWHGDRAKMENAWHERYGFEVDWPTVRDNAIQEFADRENGKKMQWLHRRSPGGFAFRALSTGRKLLGQAGRLDDIDAYGNAVMKSTR